MEDNEIYKLLLSDSDSGLYELIKKYNAYVKAIASRVLINRQQDIEECVADTFLQVWKHRKSIKIGESMKGLIACIARNTAINRYNILKREHTVDLECQSLASEDEIESLIEKIYQDEVVDLMLHNLDENHREIFVRRHILMETIAEIASDMNMNERYIRNSLYRSKIKLKESLRRR